MMPTMLNNDSERIGNALSLSADASMSPKRVQAAHTSDQQTHALYTAGQVGEVSAKQSSLTFQRYVAKRPHQCVTSASLRNGRP